mmetsp:Transcript_29793/g.67402  ORF Transcript_29793/g.67402 Transcript_29793/m.67402 type:complete len:498 (-) Transcript_29793:24-1517(-)
MSYIASSAAAASKGYNGAAAASNAPAAGDDHEPIIPTDACQFDTLFGIAGKKDVVAQGQVDPEELHVEGFDQFFGGQTMFFDSLDTSDAAAKSQAAAGNGATAKSEQGTRLKLNSFETPKAAAAEEPESQNVVRVRVVHGLSTVSNDRLKRALVVLGKQAAGIEAGRQLVHDICQSDYFEEIMIANTQSIVEYQGRRVESVKQMMIDLDHIDEEALTGYDVAFCFLGHVKEEAGVDGFWSVVEKLGPSGLEEIEQTNHIQVVNLAKALLANGCVHFHLLSSANAESESHLAFSKAKGAAEKEIAELGFKRVVIYRPGFLRGKKVNSVGDAFTAFFAVPALEVFYPTDASVSVTSLSRAMLSLASASQVQDFEVLENEDILKAADSPGDGWFPAHKLPELDKVEWDTGDKSTKSWADSNKEDPLLEMFEAGSGAEQETKKDKGQGDDFQFPNLFGEKKGEGKKGEAGWFGGYSLKLPFMSSEVESKEVQTEPERVHLA